MMYMSENPAFDAERYEAEKDRKLAQRPICTDCHEHIQDDTAFYINGEWICDRCMDEYRQEVFAG